MLSTAKSTNVKIWQVVQLFAPPTIPAIAPRAENSFYKFEKNFLFFFGCQQCAHKY